MILHVDQNENQVRTAYKMDARQVLEIKNSTKYITGSQGQVENAYAYDAFGNLRGQAGELQNRILYTGQQYGQELDLYYLRARYYNLVVYYDPRGYNSNKDKFLSNGSRVYYTNQTTGQTGFIKLDAAPNVVNH